MAARRDREATSTRQEVGDTDAADYTVYPVGIMGRTGQRQTIDGTTTDTIERDDARVTPPTGAGIQAVQPANGKVVTRRA